MGPSTPQGVPGDGNHSATGSNDSADTGSSVSVRDNPSRKSAASLLSGGSTGGSCIDSLGGPKIKTFVGRLLKTKCMDALLEQVANSELHRTLGAFDLTLLGVGEIVGTGIFVLTGTAAANHAGPAVVLSFVIAGIASMFAALCYSELASIIPVAGSAYTYSYATLGSFVGWTIGWDLCLEYLVGAATVSVGWSAYLRSFLASVGYDMPTKWSRSPVGWDVHREAFYVTGDYVDLPAMAIALVMTGLLVFGIKESARINAVIVAIKLSVIVIFICAMGPHVDRSNWEPFVPPNEGTFGRYGISGIFQGASVVFFSYIGFDSVSCCAQECKKPERDLPIGTLSSLAICTTLYILVALIATGLLPYYEFKGIAHPISYAVEGIEGYEWLEMVINIGAIAGLTSVILVSLMSQPRIFYAMAVDGFVPAFAAKVHPRYKTPWVTTIITGALCALCAGILPIEVLSELTSVGTLFAFVLVCIGVSVLRYRRPNLERKFQVPFGPWLIPGLGASISFLLICTSSTHTIYRLMVWMAIGWIIYFVWGLENSQKVMERTILPNREHDDGNTLNEGRGAETGVAMVTTDS
ncbi:cationic amino acid transporter [Nannochloropsis gaditana]|uniref:Cationic amino acid transporter n=1 Tax=Nannochloropsis gaditana TaxID=72520 RepID=W7TVS9_9STRA|nr:cationic amino acid transporter [Nannochloropsis gaditana]